MSEWRRLHGEERERTLQALREIGQSFQRDKALKTLDGYRRAALGEVIIPEPMYPDERGVWPVTIPLRVMCRRLLEWNDAS